MVFGSIISSPRGSLSLQQVVDLANIYLENACKASDPDIALVLCHDAEVSLSQVKRVAKHTEDKTMREGIATVYLGLGELLNNQGHRDEAQAFYKKSEKWGGRAQKSGRLVHASRPIAQMHSIKSVHSVGSAPVESSSLPSSQSFSKQENDMATIPQNVFSKNVSPPVIDFKPPELDARLDDTLQLACCLGLLRTPYSDIADVDARNWLQTTKNEPEEHERLKTLATEVIRAFKRDEFKDAKAVTEVVYLAPVLGNDDFRYLLKEFYLGIDQSGLLDTHQLEGLAQLIQGADPGYLDADDLVKVLGLLSARLRDTHYQSSNHLYQLTLAVSHVLDAMADTKVEGLDREKIHEPLLSYLDELKDTADSYLIYQAAYAYQALLCVPDNETLWQATLRRTGKVIQGVSGLVSAVKGLDLNGFIEGLKDIHQGVAGTFEAVKLVKKAYDGCTALAENGQGFFECLMGGFSFSGKCAWYPALRGADTLIQDGHFVEFKRLAYEAPCRHDPAFQWGICQRLGEIAANSMWDIETRQGAMTFLGEIYRNDSVWGRQPAVKQRIVSILMQLSSIHGGEMIFIESLLQELQDDGDAMKQDLYRVCRENGPGNHPLKIILPTIGSPSLLDRVQERPDVEGNLSQLRRQRLKGRGKVVYIQPQAKASLQARDEARFSLMAQVEEFLAGDQKVFLLLGDSGAGKSTFNRELECQLWQSYKKNGAIPLHINLPAIDKPDHDMIAKQLRRLEFTEPQIRELKLHRAFILICDGYDESQQTHNLYTSNRLNQPGEWNAKMVVSCRSEYVGVDYRDRFQPGDRNHRSESALFLEAVITPFSKGQVLDYINQYVSFYRPLWGADEYRRALDSVPGLKELVTNPFLMSLSLEVLPRMIDPRQDFSATRITRVELYDQFINHWLERGKKRLREKNLSPQARSAFESLIDEGFTRNGINYLKRLSKAIYKEQGGQPIVLYSRYKDEGSWKSEFFSREDEKQLLREACPLIRSENQHRFIHRSLLEYGLTLAIFDPHERNEKLTLESVLARRGSTSSDSSSIEDGSEEEKSAIIEQVPDIDSPLAWRNLMKDLSILQFLEERVQQEPLFKQQLLSFVEQSKLDKKWRIAAANAITILVRANVQFNGADLRGIRIPKADLSYGVFDSAQLEGADLRQVDLRGAWLRKANLSKALMTGVQFGELPFLRHDSVVEMSVFSPDGTSIAVVLHGGKINLYSTSTWESLCVLSDHKASVTDIMYSPDGNWIISGSFDTTVRLWDIRSGACRLISRGHRGRVMSIDYSPCESQFASASTDETVKLWNAETGECIHTLVGHTEAVGSVMYSPKGDQIASSSEDSSVRLWSVETAQCSYILRGHTDIVTTVVYSPQGGQVASASADKTLRLWSVATGECLQIMAGHGSEVGPITYSPKGDQIASVGMNRELRLWDVDTGACLHTLLGHTDEIKSIAYSPQGDLVASASDDYTVRLWDAETGICRQMLTGHSQKISGVVFSPISDQVASCSYDGTVRLWDVRTRTSYQVLGGHNGKVRMVNCSPKGDQIATCSEDTTVRLWDVESGTCRHVLRGHNSAVRCVIYSPHGAQIATGSGDMTIRLWNVKTGVCVRTLAGHGGVVFAVSYSPQGDRLASASEDTTLRLWDVHSGECLFILNHDEAVHSVAYAPNSNNIASCSLGKAVQLWDTETGISSYTFTGHSNMISRIVYSPRGDQVASSSDDDTVRLWDVATGDCHHTLTGHEGGVISIAYSPNGEQIASTSEDLTVRIWHVETGACLQTLSGHSGVATRVVYSPQGDLLVTSAHDKSVRLWDTESGQCRATIQVFRYDITDIAWMETTDVNYLVAGCEDGSVWILETVNDGNLCHVRLCWSSGSNGLIVTEADIQDVQGLSQLNKQLLKQRGAVGEPVHRLRENIQKVASMASVVSKLKDQSDTTEEDPASTASASVELLEQWLEQARGPICQEIVAAIVKTIHGYK